MRRCHLTVMVTLLAACLVGVRGAATASERPNILWITCEDMSPRLGCYGDTTVPTPNIDRLAAQGVRYLRAYGTYGVCAPNRHTLIMGMYPSSTGAMAMRTWKRTSALKFITDPELLAIPTYEATPPPEAKCFSEYLRAAGYYCTNNSKTDYQFRTPVTAWDESGRKAHWRNRPDPEMPFFAVFNSTVTHESKVFRQTSPRRVDPADVPVPPYYPDTPIVRRDLARQYDNIAVMDEWVGGILTQLEEDGLADETIVFFYSDHGDGLPRMKRWVYDSGIQVPLIVRYPDRRDAGTTSGELVSFVDFAPTVLSLCGCEIPAHMQGQAFLGPDRAEPRKYIYACRDRMDPAPETIRAVRDERFKYVRNYRPELPYIGYIPYRDQQEIMQDILRLRDAGKLGPDQWQFTAQHKPLEELYDCQSDPHEIHNLASDPRYFDKLAELREAHERWTEETGDLGHIAESELIRRLWPPDGRQPTTATPTIAVQAGTVTIDCDSEGASIAWRTGDESRWRLYTGPVEVESGATVRAQAIRYGWKPSGIAKITVP
ncbi:sulfatase-like hydrolase/transferase [Maioricimonas sp. JC845]|uniref:sulfatase-like hydrolase/transferase n=1 Tax=Maioricimonas sp. JC845 TaxID=3232138 RepID=UPI00345AB0CA